MLFYFISQEAAQMNPAVIDIDIVDEGVRAGEINPFEKAGSMRTASKFLSMDFSVLVDEDNLASLYIFNVREIHDIEADAL
jgi:hypothetical protein